MSDVKSNKKPKIRQCAQTKKNLKRISWYYREGAYFANKAAFKVWKEAKLKAKAEAQAAAEQEAKAAAEAAEAAKNAPAEETPAETEA